MKVTWLEVPWTLAYPRWRRDWRARLGLETAAVMPGSVWVHGASVGEAKAALALAVEIKGPVLVTADTPEGRDTAERLAGGLEGVTCTLRPADHPWALAPLWAEARPRALVFIEGAWWPQLASLASCAGVPVIRASAKAGPVTRRWGRAGLYRRWVRETTAVFARDQESASWFEAHQDAPVTVCGDLKLDAIDGGVGVQPPQGRSGFVVGACTHPGEEAALWKAVQATDPDLGLLIAPRDLSRVGAVVDELRGRGAPAELASKGQAGADRAAVVVLDTLGALAPSLKGAKAVFVGGTFHPHIGGHSPIEAWKAGCPTVAGPEIWAHPESFRGAQTRVVDTLDELAEGLRAAVEPPEAPEGPAATIAAHLRGHLGPWAPERAPRPWARPLAWIWQALSALKLRAPVALAVPVVAVGSANARGSGKTTTGRWVARELADRGYRVGVVARGYRRTARGGALLYREGVSGAEMGDDAYLYARDGHEVATGPRRKSCCALLLERRVDVVVLEDGLQQTEIAADWRIEVVDADYPGARGPLPAGERRARQGPVDVTVCLNGRGAPQAVEGSLERQWHRGEREYEPPLTVALFAGTGRPAVVKDAVGGRVARFMAVRNHAPIGLDAWDRLRRWAGDLPLATTAKDYARIAHLPGADQVWWLDQAATFEDPSLVVPEDKFPRSDREPQGCVQGGSS